MKTATTDWGLVADGTTDNTAALNTGLAAWTTSQGYILFPAGTYVFKSQPSTLPAGIRFVGEGQGLTILKGTRTSALTDGVLALGNNVTLENLTVTTTDDANSVFMGVICSGSTGIKLRNITVSNAAATGLRAASPAQVFASGVEFTNIYQFFSASGVAGAFQNSDFSNCWWHDGNATLGTNHAVYLNGTYPNIAYNVTFRGCRFQNWGLGPVMEVQGDVNNTPNALASNICIDGCTFQSDINHDGSGIIALCTTGLQITNNNFASAVGNCISIYTSNENFLVKGNVIQGVAGALTYAGIVVTQLGDTGNGVIEGNLITYPYTLDGQPQYLVGQGIAVSSCTENLTIRGNFVSGLYAGVTLNALGTGNALNGVRIEDNDFVIPAGATDATTGGRQSYLGAFRQTAGVAILGTATRITVKNNRVSNMGAELLFGTGTSQSTGTATKIEFSTPNLTPLPSCVTVLNGALPSQLHLDGAVPSVTSIP